MSDMRDISELNIREADRLETINRFAEAMPEQFLLNTVGTTYVFNGD